MRQNNLQLVDEGYVGELFPFVVEGNHGSEDGSGRHVGSREGLYCWMFDDDTGERTLDVRGCKSCSPCDQCYGSEEVGTWRRREVNGRVIEEFVRLVAS